MSTDKPAATRKGGTAERAQRPHRPRAAADRARLVRKRRVPPGAPPGTLIADETAPGPVVRVLSYDPKEIEAHEVASAKDVGALVGRRAVTWVEVQGLGDIETIRTLGEIFGLHALALEDVVNVHQRPKVEDYGQYLFIVTRMPLSRTQAETEQLSMFLGKDYVLTFHERPTAFFGTVRDRLGASPEGRIRSLQADYLAYTLLDAAIDGYFPVLEAYGDAVEELEDAVVAQPTPELVSRIHGLKRDLLALRRAIWPQREMVNALVRDETPLLSNATRVYLRDVYDHAIQLLDFVETYREILSGLIDVYLSSTSARMNEIMKVLTIIATIFIPLGFVAGLYGMNFNPQASRWNMPELSWSWGYPYALVLMTLIAGAMLVYFWKKGWIGRSR